MDSELADVWRRWWLPEYDYKRALPEKHADRELLSLIEHLEGCGFAIVRRMDPDLPG